MGFYIERLIDDIFVIAIDIKDRPNVLIDAAIAELLYISYKKYRGLLISHGANYKVNYGFVFDNIVQANKFADYLNETYLIALKLIGDV